MNQSDNLDERLRAHYQQRRLPSARIERLLARPSRARRVPVSLRMGLALCATALLAFVLLNYSQVNERTRHTIREAVLNHNANLAPEFTASSLVDLKQSMRLLPFELGLPQRFAEGFTLAGARYCTISGRLAVHLKLFDDHAGREVSLFATRLFDDLQALGERARILDGVGVELWQENDLFYVLAQSAEQ